MDGATVVAKGEAFTKRGAVSYCTNTKITYQHYKHDYLFFRRNPTEKTIQLSKITMLQDDPRQKSS